MVIRHAAQLLTLEGDGLGIIEDGALVIEQGKIVRVGPSAEIPRDATGDEFDATGRVVLPGFVDCHTHLVFAGWRDAEFAQRLAGRSYREIAQAGGGILSTVRATRAATEDELYETALPRLAAMQAWGTTTVEIKSGYGLDTATELKLLRVIRRLGQDCRMTVVPTFLGAHSVPPELSKARYIDRLEQEMLPAVADQGLARFCDVFCENFVFNAGESQRILEAGKRHGLVPKVHADEIEPSGGAETAARVGAVSAEHLLVPADTGLQLMREHGVIAVLLPGTSFFLRTAARAPVARMRELGLTMALGSDFNPGSCTLYALPVVITLACVHYGLTVEEAIRGATINAARALQLADRKGSLSPGKDADVLLLDIPHYRHLAYRFAHNPVALVIQDGRVALMR